MRFQCPVCDSPECDRVIVERPDGSAYRTEFFFCLGCTMMFREPELFTAAPELRRTFVTSDAPRMAHEVSLMRQELEHRYVRARLKRCGGGMEPTSEQVAAALRRRPL